MAEAANKRFRIAGRTALALFLLVPVACQQKMAVQPSYKPLDPSEFFPDGRSARPLVPGTVARGHLRTDVQFFTGKEQRPLAHGTAAAAAALGSAGGGGVTAAASLAAA